jgi:hypothetical protein
MSAQLIGLDTFKRQAAATAAAIRARARTAAQQTAARVAARVRSHVRVASGQLRDAVTVEEHAAEQTFAVGFKDVAGRNPMVPVWHEFGTKDMAANPALGDALAAERGRYLAEMRAAIDSALQEHGR